MLSLGVMGRLGEVRVSSWGGPGMLGDVLSRLDVLELFWECLVASLGLIGASQRSRLNRGQVWGRRVSFVWFRANVEYFSYAILKDFNMSKLRSL